MAGKQKIAVVLFNLGGPDSLDAVQPFLENLFSDPCILRVPGLIRPWLARRIARKRTPQAQEIYQHMGGGSPILPNTKAQADALSALLADCGTVKVFVCMRYWHPRAAEVVRAVEAFVPDQIVFLPLYPQYSTTTSASSVAEFWAEVQALDGDLHRRWQDEMPVKTVCCYPTQPGFIAAQGEAIKAAYMDARQFGKPRLLLSAHGLPEKIVRAGDPYQWQCEATAQALVKSLDILQLDWINCYQSRVGPLKWIGPATEDEILRAGRDKVPVVLAPIAFVSEHSETLVELDIEYRQLAEEKGVPYYVRVPTVSVMTDFIAGLADLVREALGGENGLQCPGGQRLCPKGFKGCPAQERSKAV